MSTNGDIMDEDDPVVREIDVYVCNTFLGSQTQLGLFQYPLRPPWRPYTDVKAMRMKPNAKRVEVDMKLDTKSQNYNEIIEDFKKISQVTLRSTLVEPKTSLAVGVLDNGKFLMAPLDYCIQLRPNLAHLDVGNQKKKHDSDDDDEDEDEPEMHAVEVQVQRRETERQQQARLNSYAYISQKEEEEQWVPLSVSEADSNASTQIWERFMIPSETPIPASMDRVTYLKSFLGASVPGTDSAAQGPAGSSADAAQADAGTDQLSDAVKQHFITSLKALLQKHSVCSMANVRQWLLDPSQAPAKEAATLTDKALHQAITESGLVINIRRMYVLKKTGIPQIDPFRDEVIEILQEKDGIKRAELMEAANKKKIVMTESLYNKVVKDLCMSRGSLWHLKLGADM